MHSKSKRSHTARRVATMVLALMMASAAGLRIASAGDLASGTRPTAPAALTALRVPARDAADPTASPTELTLATPRDTLYFYDIVHGNVKVMATSPQGRWGQVIPIIHWLAVRPTPAASRPFEVLSPKSRRG